MAGDFGNMPLNGVRGPGRQNWNLALFKSFRLQRVAAAVLNSVRKPSTLNHTQFKDVSNTFTNSNFGAVTTAHDPREMQLGVKLYY